MNKSIVHNQNKVEKSNRYSTARGMAGFIAVMGWICAAVGALILIKSEGISLVSFLVAAAFIIPGLLMVAGGQVIKALLDMANNSWEMAENTQQIRFCKFSRDGEGSRRELDRRLRSSH